MKKMLSKRPVQIAISSFVFTTSFLLMHYSPLNEVHGRSDAALIVAVFGVFALFIAYILDMKYLMTTATFGYIIALLLGAIFNFDVPYEGGGTSNNLWQIWLVSYWMFIGIGIVIDIIKRLLQKKTPDFTDEILKKENENKDEHKYLTYGTALGLPVGTAIAVIASLFLGGTIGMWIGIGASLGMLIGVVVGTTIDYEIKNKKSNK